MSDYRDDSNDTAVASDSTWIGLTAISEGTAKITESVFFGLLVLHASGAVASDEVIDRPAHLLVDQAQVVGEAIDHLHARQALTDTLRVRDRATGVLRVLHEDGAGLDDLVLDRVRSVTVDGAQIGDQVLAARRVSSLTIDSLRISDSTGQFTSTVVEDAARISDWAGGTLRARVTLTDALSIADQVIDAHQATAPPASDSARITAVVLDHLAARDLVSDGGVIEDVTVGGGQNTGQAWTANVDSWAMSRYAPYTFSGLAVIDGQLYGLADDGVYALKGGSGNVAGSFTTGKLDLGRERLVHPHTAYLEYALEGEAFMDVTTTQSGNAESYSYPLETKPANELSSGRFTFGRGLRGRHFAFTLRLTGKHAYINDLRVESAPTNRRV